MFRPTMTGVPSGAPSRYREEPMINNIFSFPIQATVQTLGESPIVAPFESSTLWIDDFFTMLLVYNY